MPERVPSPLGSIGSDWSLAAEAGLALFAVRLGLRRWGLMPLERFLSAWRAGASAEPSFDPERAARIVAAVARRGPLRAACLERSLATQLLCARRGLTTDLVIGVDRTATGLAAHAWLEQGSMPLAEGAETLARFAVLAPANRLPVPPG